MSPVKKRVSSTVTKRKANPRPRKYASASERQAAYRARAPEVCFRAEPKTVETLDRIAETLDQSRADVLLSMTKFALANHDWARFGLTHKPLPFEYGVNPIMATKKRKPTPAQLAARERFAEMARSGAFAKGRKRNPADAAPYTVTWKSTASGRMQTSNYRTKAEAVRDAQSLAAEGAKNVEVSKYSPSTGAVAVEWRKTNPAKKTVSQKISQLTREGYPNRQAVAIALNEERAGKVRRNPAPKRERMLNISWLTPGGEREVMSVPIEFTFTEYVGNVAERFFARLENGFLIVSEYSTGGRVGQVPHTMRAAALNDNAAAKQFTREMIQRVGPERFRAAIKKFSKIN